jgi:hypothetical protein
LSTLAIVGVSAIAITKLSTSALSALSSNYAKKLKITARVEGMWKKKFGPWGKFISAIGVATALTQLYENLFVLEAMYVQGKLPGKDGGYAKLVEQREFEFLQLDILSRYEIFKEEVGDLAKKIPQHQIASYLGITPVALSRVLSKVRKKPIL